ncbi:MAG: hypothetical protein HQM12_18380 [SAR324 cluster bacterium]|nr:hypothetical protein [SAR324 cluster bacterium]
MDAHLNISEKIRDLFTEFFHIGVGRSAAALSEMLSHEIEMEVPQLFFLNHEAMAEYSKEMAGDYVCVTQQITGDMTGFATLSFPIMNGKTLVDSILINFSQKPEFGTIEIEALQEIGNIVICALSSAFSDIFQFSLDYNLPTVSFISTPIPFFPESLENFYVFSITKLILKNTNIGGAINFSFAYSDFQKIEKFVDESMRFSKLFGEILLEKKMVTPEQLEHALKIQKSSNRFIGELLVDHGYITEEQRNQILTSPKYRADVLRFGEILLQESLIQQDQLQILLDMQKSSRSFLGELLIYLGYLNSHQRDAALQEQYSS